jgi:ABC-type molybdate transport system substrate-binding protein
MEPMQLRKWACALLIGAGIFATSAAQAADVIRVAYAGSMGVVMDRFIGPAFAKANNIEFQGIGQGAYGLARQLEGSQRHHLASAAAVRASSGSVGAVDDRSHRGATTVIETRLAPQR